MTMSSLIYPTLAPENWPFSLKCLPQPAYIVGGAVRDALLGRTREYLDLDFVIPADAVKLARDIARDYQAGFVLLDPQRHIARVVFPNATADFARQEGDSLETDLHRSADLEQGLLRMISRANLEDDPLRLLRAYRQAAQLDFTIEPTTKTTIKALASQITQVAAERVRVEIGYLLASPQGTPWITTAGEDNLLVSFFPHATRASFHKLAAVDTAAALLGENWPQLGTELQQSVRDTVKMTWLGIAKLACLVDANPEVAETELQALTYSRAEIRAVTTALKLLPQLKSINMSLREQYFLFQEAGNVFPATVLLALVDDILVEAMSGHRLLRAYAPMISRYLNPDDLVAHATQIVSGKELILALNIPASPVVGELLTEIAIARAEEKITTPEQAIAFARSLLKN
jgi:tRNA nucleotidyltransferase (CCA-adding enzyme)